MPQLLTPLRPTVDFIHHGTPAFRRANLALFALGVATFGLLYSVQPMMPVFSREFHVSAAQSALSLSLPSGVLAVAMLLAGPVSNSWGRKALMSGAMLASSAIVLLSAVAPNWQSFLILRALLGVTLGGLPAVAMTYLSEEVHADSIGLGMGLYIGGNAVGGLGGRLIAGVVTDFYDWRRAIAVVGLVGVAAAVVFMVSLPPARYFHRRPLHWRGELQMFAGLFRDRGLPWLFAEGFLLLGSFVTIYNYIGYRLMASPYALRQSTVGLIFSAYLVGTFSSAWVGHLAGRLGRRRVLWPMFVMMLIGLGVTLFETLWLIIAGIVIITFGFFGAHSVASSWVGRRSGAAKAQASATYLFLYYLGSSVAGATGGLFYTRFGWNGVAAFVAAVMVAGLGVAWRLYFLKPLP